MWPPNRSELTPKMAAEIGFVLRRFGFADKPERRRILADRRRAGTTSIRRLRHM
jgi:hypothetical protein